jgi:hypothetical protein
MKNFFQKIVVAGGLLTFVTGVAVAQDTLNSQTLGGKRVNSITTAVPFLLIAPDSRHGAMGDAGVSSTPDVFSNHWNPSKLAFVDRKYALAISYTPWLQKLVPDINLSYLSGYYRIDSRQTLGASLRYFSLGEITFTDQTGNQTGSGNPNELALDLAYARKLSDRFSIGTAFRFINSDLAQGQNVSGQDIKPGRAVAADISMYYTNPDLKLNGKKTTFAAGMNISNIGNKMSYTDASRRYFIPTNMRVGASGKMKLDDYNEITLMIDANKLLVPTNPLYGKDSAGNVYIIKGEDPDKSLTSGIFGSFNDAPNGMKEELQEISYSVGFEYWYDKQFAFRGGYFYEHPLKGNRQYFTMGAGIKYNVFGLDLSYLIPTQQQNPLENTLRFSLTFNFEDPKEKQKN